jgi:hypothetical protein
VPSGNWRDIQYIKDFGYFVCVNNVGGVLSGNQQIITSNFNWKSNSVFNTNAGANNSGPYRIGNSLNQMIF